MNIQFNTAEGAAIKRFIQEHLTSDIDALKDIHNTETQTQFLRGRIDFAEQLLSLEITA